MPALAADYDNRALEFTVPGKAPLKLAPASLSELLDLFEKPEGKPGKPELSIDLGQRFSSELLQFGALRPQVVTADENGEADSGDTDATSQSA